MAEETKIDHERLLEAIEQIATSTQTVYEAIEQVAKSATELASAGPGVCKQAKFLQERNADTIKGHRLHHEHRGTDEPAWSECGD